MPYFFHAILSQKLDGVLQHWDIYQWQEHLRTYCMTSVEKNIYTKIIFEDVSTNYNLSSVIGRKAFEKLSARSIACSF